MGSGEAGLVGLSGSGRCVRCWRSARQTTPGKTVSCLSSAGDTLRRDIRLQ